LPGTIANGGEHWFIGHPTHSPSGTVALIQTSAIKLVFRQEDIKEVHKLDDERFVVRVAAEANMLISHEHIVKATAVGCGCSGKKVTDESKVKSLLFSDGEVYIFNEGSCWFRFECTYLSIPFAGPIRVCILTGLGCE
jgi:hypothetical protein